MHQHEQIPTATAVICNGPSSSDLQLPVAYVADLSNARAAESKSFTRRDISDFQTIGDFHPGVSQQPPMTSLIEFQNRYEIDGKWMSSMSDLVLYNSVLILDDSGSM